MQLSIFYSNSHYTGVYVDYILVIAKPRHKSDFKQILDEAKITPRWRLTTHNLAAYQTVFSHLLIMYMFGTLMNEFIASL